LQRISWYSKCT